MKGIADQLGMKVLKPLVLQWCVDSWNGLRERKQLILDGWEQSCTKLFNINSEKRRRDAVELVALKTLELDVLPDGTEPDGYAEEADCEDDEGAELDITRARTFGKQGERVRTQAKVFGFMLDPTRIEIDQELHRYRCRRCSVNCLYECLHRIIVCSKSIRTELELIRVD